MGIGYIMGCLLSMVCFNFNRQKYWGKFHKKLKLQIKNKYFLQGLYLIAISILVLIFYFIKNNEIVNGIIAFLVIEINYVEKKSDVKRKKDQKKKFYRTLSLISKSFICGFIGPLLYISLFGNWGGILYFFINQISNDSEMNIFNVLINILNIIPTIIGCGILYLIYCIRNRTFKINFKGDYFSNLLNNPLLNVYIVAAYIESVNFYYIEEKGVHYIKSYGVYSSKIDDVSIRDFLSIIYGICFFIYIIFLIIVFVRYS
ncbi:MAG: hypothetical protein E6929_10460 [Clostridium sp.]|nr:hypothetical protein [Clostridium sp.]